MFQRGVQGRKESVYPEKKEERVCNKARCLFPLRLQRAAGERLGLKRRRQGPVRLPQEDGLEGIPALLVLRLAGLRVALVSSWIRPSANDDRAAGSGPDSQVCVLMIGQAHTL